MAFWIFKSGKHNQGAMHHVSKIRLLYSTGGYDFVRYIRLYVVFFERSRAGNFHGDLDSIHFRLRYLFQARCPAGKESLMETNLLAIGAVVFALLLVGLALTVLEFRKIK